jgi:hypothetical protein
LTRNLGHRRSRRTAAAADDSAERHRPAGQRPVKGRHRPVGVVPVVVALMLAAVAVIGFCCSRPTSRPQVQWPPHPRPSVRRPSQTTPAATVQTSPANRRPIESGAPPPVTGLRRVTVGPSAPTAADTAGVTDYYALMPTDTDAGWARLTPAFQTKIARNRDSYESFWNGIDRVVATDVTGAPPDRAEATISYFFTDGRVAVEPLRIVQEPCSSTRGSTGTGWPDPSTGCPLVLGPPTLNGMT